LEEEDRELLADMFFTAKKVAKNLWIDEWYQLHFNVWEKWGQVVEHIHLHLTSNI
jgi:diadenosine tetraphosphate (Ap4A) HIT family hydrolase